MYTSMHVNVCTIALSTWSTVFPSRYLVTHINELQALVIVQHNGGFYNLYLSDQSGVYFSLSLRDIAVVGVNTVDLELVS